MAPRLYQRFFSNRFQIRRYSSTHEDGSTKACDSTGKIAGFVSQVEYFGLGADYLEGYADRVRAITAEDVQRAARTYLRPDSLIQVVVGPASKLAGDAAIAP